MTRQPGARGTQQPCCEGVQFETPQKARSAPGQPALALRTGTHGQFLASMHARLSGPAYPALAGLTARGIEDPALTLLDGAASLADVLAFHTERVADEGFLRTATDDESVRLLTGLLGYRTRPGLAAQTYLAFTVDVDPTAPDTISFVPAGTQARSQPEPGGQPQTFETLDGLPVRASWNRLPVRQREPVQALVADADGGSLGLTLVGTATALASGDAVLLGLRGAGGPGTGVQQRLAVVTAVDPDPEAKLTAVTVRLLPRPAADGADGVDGAAEADGGGTAGPAGPARPAGVGGTVSTGVEGPDAVDPALDGLAAMLEYLRLRPVATPASSRVMPRDPAQVFGPGSDLAPRLIAALDPAVADGLFAAWRGLVAPSDQAPDAVRALRLTAAPFGAVAPFSAGESETPDWPLSVTNTLTVRWNYDADGPTHVTIQVIDGGAAAIAELPLAADGTVTVVRWTASVVGPSAPADDAPPVVLTLTSPDGDRHVIAVPSRPGSAADELSVTLTGDAPGEAGAFDVSLAEHAEAVRSWPAWSVRASRPEAGTVEVELAGALPHTRCTLALDARHDGIGIGSWVAVERPRKGAPGGIPGDPGLAQVIAKVTAVDTQVVTDYGISAQVTVLTLDRDWLDSGDTSLADVRDARIRARSQPLALATRPLTTAVAGGELELATLVEGLAPGRWVSVAGERTDLDGISGVTGSEVAMIAGVRHLVDEAVPGDTVRTVLRLLHPLAYRYRRSTVHVAGNVTRATAGATRNEVLGSGDAARAGQSFTLLQHPVTWLSADTPTGAASTLRVFVDGELWREVDSFAGCGPRDRVHVTQVLSDGRVVVRFGDGVQGSRLSTGVENVRARYRVGLGAGGNVAPHRVNQLVTRPPAVSGVDNPVRAAGGADPDTPARARRDAPLAVTALDRLVGLRDYEDFARRWAGIGRAKATRLVTDGRESVHVTVAGVGDAILTEDSATLTNLRSALLAYGEPWVPVAVQVRELHLLVLRLLVAVDADHPFDLVEPVLRAGLLARFGFDARELAQPVYVSQILAAAQAVPGVDHVGVDVLATVSDADPVTSVRTLATTWGDPAWPRPPLADPVPAYPARLGADGAVLPAQLLYLSAEVADTLILTEVRS